MLKELLRGYIFKYFDDSVVFILFVLCSLKLNQSRNRSSRGTNYDRKADIKDKPPLPMASLFIAHY